MKGVGDLSAQQGKYEPVLCSHQLCRATMEC
jgi:hypothetical protein